MSHGVQEAQADRGGVGNPAGLMGRRAPLGTRDPACAKRSQADRVYDGPETPPDHDRKRLGESRRKAAAADLPCALCARAYAAAIAPRPFAARLRRFGEGARAAGLDRPEVVATGTGG